MSGARAVASIAVASARGRLDRFLAARGDWGSRSQIQHRIERGEISVNGKAAKPGTVLRRGDVVRITLCAAAPPDEIEAADIPLEVLYEDEDLLAINKPPGMVVHPAPGHRQDTLVSALLHRWQGPRPGLDERRPGIVHRLDRDTSGVLLIGKTAETVTRLASQFRSRSVRKEYLAVVWRCPRPPSGVVDRPIGRHPTQRKRMTVRAGGRPALTRYKVVEDYGDAAVLRVLPESGRTHQIRVHLAAIGHAVVGDPLYGRRPAGADAVLAAFPRQALHAAAISFRHPRSAAPISLEACPPDDLQRLLAYLRDRGARRRRAPEGGEIA